MKAELILRVDDKEKVLINFSRTDLIALKNDLLSIEDWYSKGPAKNKVFKCRKRFIEEWTRKLIADPDVIDMPANEDDMIKMVYKRSDYMNREKRDETS